MVSKNYKNSQSSIFIKDKNEYELYKEKVSFFTNYSLEQFDINGKERLGKYWHLDHKYPQAMGFNNNIPTIYNRITK